MITAFFQIFEGEDQIGSFYADFENEEEMLDYLHTRNKSQYLQLKLESFGEDDE